MLFSHVEKHGLADWIKKEIAKSCNLDRDERKVYLSEDALRWRLNTVAGHFSLPINNWLYVLISGAIFIPSFWFIFSQIPSESGGLTIFLTFGYSFVLSLLIGILANQVAKWKNGPYRKLVDDYIQKLNRSVSPISEISCFVEWKEDDTININMSRDCNIPSGKYRYQGVLKDQTILLKKIRSDGEGKFYPFPPKFLSRVLDKNKSLKERKNKKLENSLKKELDEVEYNEILEEVREEVYERHKANENENKIEEMESELKVKQNRVWSRPSKI